MSNTNIVEDTILKCQNCQLPLKMDSSLLDLSFAQTDILVSSGGDYTPTNCKIPQDRLRRLNKAINPNEATLQKLGLESYVLLQEDLKHDGPSAVDSVETSVTTSMARRDDDSGDEQMEEDRTHHRYSAPAARTLSTQVSALANVFNLLSSKSNIDYPVCQDCCNILVQRLQSEYDDAIKERDLYTQFLSRIEKQKAIHSNESPVVTNDEAEKLNLERESLFKELVRLENEDEELDKQIADLEQQLQEKQRLEEEDLKRKNSYELEQLEFAKEIQSLKNQYEFSLNNLDKLRKINIYNETFKISHNGPFGIINGLRIGGFEDIKVPWQEINAALGQVILLLATITTRLEVKLDGYKLLPMGSYSKISKYQEDSQEWVVYDAFNNDNFKIGKLFKKETSFDKAMESLLTVVRQMAIWLSRSGSQRHGSTYANASEIEEPNEEEIELPYVMHKDKINGISVKLFGGKPNIEWTTAMKFLLTNTKWLFAFSSTKLG